MQSSPSHGFSIPRETETSGQWLWRQIKCISTHFSVMTSLMTRKNKHANNQSTTEHLILIRNHQVAQFSAPGWITVLLVGLENSVSQQQKKAEHGQVQNLLSCISIRAHRGNVQGLEGKVDLVVLFLKDNSRRDRLTVVKISPHLEWRLFRTHCFLLK